MDNLWVLVTLIIVFCIFSLVGCRVAYIKGFRKGALKVLAEWKEVNKKFEGDDFDEEM